MAIVQSEGSLLQTGQSWRYPASGAMGGSVTWYDGMASDYASIWRAQPNVRTVVDFYARNISQIGIKAFERIDDTDRRSLSGSPLADFLRSPNPAIKLTRQRWIMWLVGDLKVYGNSFWLKVRNPTTNALRVVRLAPELMMPVEGSSIYATKWRFMGFDGQPVYSSDDLLHFSGYNPIDGRMGSSPIETLRQILAEDVAAGQYREQFWRGGARLSGIIQRPAPTAGTPRWSTEGRDRFLAEWNATFSGTAPNAGSTAVLEDGMTFNPATFSAKDSEYVAARRLSREEVAAVYHLSPIFVGILDNANFSNVSEQHKNLYQDAFGPDLTAIEEDLEMQLLPEFPEIGSSNVYVEFNLTEKLKGSFQEEASVMQTSVGGPWMTRNEARARRNLPPIDGGDELIVPLNVLVGGQASPTDSAPPPTAARSVGPGRHSRKDATAADSSTSEQGWEDQHQEVMSSTFERQQSAVVSALGGGQSIDDAWNDDRWNGELKTDLLGLSTDMTTEMAQAVAAEFDGEFDPAQTAAWLEENTRIASESINSATKQQLAELDKSAPSYLDSVRNIFVNAIAVRAAQIAKSRVTSIGNFARHEGAKQAGVTHKEWDVRASNSRHPSLNGEVVAIGEKFSNGARWPGDQENLPEDQTANCECRLVFRKEQQ